MAWQFSSDRPIYVQMADQIITSILAGDYKMGEKLPSVREFAVMASVNPNTVQRALAELEDAGLVDNQRNTGKFVTQEESRIEMARKKRADMLAHEFLKGMEALGYSSQETVSILEKARTEEVIEDERSDA